MPSKSLQKQAHLILMQMTNWNIRFWEYEFFALQWLWLLLILPLLLFYLWWIERKRKGDVKFSATKSDQSELGNPWISRWRSVSIGIFGFIFALLVFAMAKPFHWASYDGNNKEFKDGIDIILTIDISGSMDIADLKPSRLEAAKKVAKEFVDGRDGDRIGLVAYAGEAYTSCPPTLDYKVLKKQIDGLGEEFIRGGTAIGLGLATAVTQLRSDSLKSKVIILLTDGVDESNEISPEKATVLAKAKNIRVYTIGVGGDGQSMMGAFFGSSIDEARLKRIAKMTDGKYFRAKDTKGLREIYKEIEKLEKRKMEDKHFKSEPPSNPTAFLNWALLLMLLTLGVNYILFKNNE